MNAFAYALLLFALAALPAGVECQNGAASEGQLAAAADSLVRRAVDSGIVPGFGLAIVREDRVVHLRGYGYADASRRIPADDATLWYIASTSKSFAGFAIVLLERRGEIDLGAPITSLLPQAEWHPDVDPERLSLRDFLTHTMGLSPGAVVDNAAFTGNVPESEWPRLLRFSAPLSTRDMIYSNLGYNVAAMVIDRLRPEGWRRFIEREVFRPVGMTETYARTSGLDAGRFAVAHTLRSDLTFQALPFRKNDVTMNAAGGHLSTLRDLARWTIVNMQEGSIDGRAVYDEALMASAHRLLAEHTVASSRSFGPWSRDGWGPGWDLGTYRGEPMISRFGAYETTRSHLSFLPHRNVGVVAMGNGGYSGSLSDLVASYIYDLDAGRPDARERAYQRLDDLIERLRGAPATIAAQDSATRSRRRPLPYPLDAYAGTYTQPGYGDMTWSIRDGRLWYEYGAWSGPADVYEADRSAFRIRFGGTGVIAQFTIDASGRAMTVDFGESGTFSRL